MEKEGAPRGSVVDRVRHKLDVLFHPASTAAEDAFREIAGTLPPGDIRRSMEEMVPKLRDLLKPQDKNLVIGSMMQATIPPVVLGVFGTVGGSLVGTPFGMTIPAAIGGGLTGVGLALSQPSMAETERMRIRTEAARQKMTLQTTAGKASAGMFDSARINEITKAIIWGTAGRGGVGSVLKEAST